MGVKHIYNVAKKLSVMSCPLVYYQTIITLFGDYKPDMVYMTKLYNMYMYTYIYVVLKKMETS